ncbi:kynurenine/alpha-aminoadipate aminotransferase, mitochondrial-like isoform X2 [Gigantopelta aegis]|uniref:kynurenine/alpha-aminoadipate aminotransferase, mitochondrial-like isoform X2 n=1 Tax=Gigantopelta aegis TaxID=1735272 RepID=UPI001B888EF5|nr:kynurenine/alpha-aminoadipate aminotransferase, mitochondrial-like isoform X2 [Gigantopelta aegis]
MEEPDLLRQDRIENYDIYLNNVSKRRTKTPFPDPEANHIYVSTGYPNPKTFPIINGQFMMNDGTTLDISEPEMKATLQYGSIAGNQELRHWLIDLQHCLHSPPLLDGGNELNTTDLIMTTGCTEGIEKVTQDHSLFL